MIVDYTKSPLPDAPKYLYLLLHLLLCQLNALDAIIMRGEVGVPRSIAGLGNTQSTRLLCACKCLLVCVSPKVCMQLWLCVSAFAHECV